MTEERRQFLTFSMGSETFAAEISSVREVVACSHITCVPGMSDRLAGVINLRGAVLSVADLRRAAGLVPGPRTPDAAIVIMDVEFEGETVTMGALVDDVQEVIDLPPDAIDPTPHAGLRLDADLVTGVGRRGDGFVIILDMNKIMTSAQDAAPLVPADDLPSGPRREDATTEHGAGPA